MQCSDFLNSCAQRLLDAWACGLFAGDVDTCDVSIVYDSIIKLRDKVASEALFGEYALEDLPF